MNVLSVKLKRASRSIAVRRCGYFGDTGPSHQHATANYPLDCRYDAERLASELAIDALCATVRQLRAELAEEKRLRAELKQIAQTGIAEVSSVGAALKDIALIDFRSRAIQFCKDKAAEWWNQQYDAEGQASALLRAQADTANELAAELEKL